MQLLGSGAPIACMLACPAYILCTAGGNLMDVYLRMQGGLVWHARGYEINERSCCSTENHLPEIKWLGKNIHKIGLIGNFIFILSLKFGHFLLARSPTECALFSTCVPTVKCVFTWKKMSTLWCSKIPIPEKSEIFARRLQIPSKHAQPARQCSFALLDAFEFF